MSDQEGTSLAERVLRATAFEYTQDVWWRVGGDDRERLDVYVTCSDVFEESLGRKLAPGEKLHIVVDDPSRLHVIAKGDAS